jgi:phospholipid-binding lipoprotein MlaA
VQATGPSSSAVRKLALAAAIAACTFAASAHAQFRAPSAKPVPAAAADALAVEDPFEGMNRRFYAIHQALDKAILRPLALGYSHATTGGLRKALHNFVTELSEPVVFGNDVLQLRVKRAATTVGRFVVNATVGFAGLFDPAAKIGLPHHDNGFGTTLGRYGVKPGPYIFLPLIGPSDFRDIIGTGVDFYSDPVGRIHYPKRGYVLLGIGIVGGLDQRANAEADLQQIESMGTDSYATLRSLYMQTRQAEIHGGGAVSINDLPSFDDPGAPASAPAPAQPEAAAPPPETSPAATDPDVSKPSAAAVPTTGPDSGPEAAWFLTAPPPRAPAAAGPPIEL